MKRNGKLGPGTWIRLMKAYNLMLREARTSLEGECTLPQFDVLAHLSREEQGLTLADLSRRLLVTAGNVTGLIDRMERTGWVKRVPDQDDRRVTRVQLTKAGKTVAARLVPQHSSDIERVFGILNDNEKTQLRQLLDKLILGMEQRP